MLKIKFIEYKGRKLPIYLTAGGLVAFKEEKDEEFQEFFQKDANETQTRDAFLLMFHIMLYTGADYYYSNFRKFWNKLFTGNNYGIKNKNVFKIMDAIFNEFVPLILYYILLSKGIDTDEEPQEVKKK